MRKAIVRLCHFAVGLATAVTLLVAAAAWRLSEGPVSADFLTPTLERTLAGDDSRLTVKIGETAISWGGWRNVIDIRTRDLTVFGADGARLAVLPEASVGLAFDALLRGRIAVERLDIYRLVAHIERYHDGTFDFDLPEVGGRPDTEAVDGGTLLGRLLAPLRGDDERLAALHSVSLLQAEIRYTDGVTNTAWTFPEVDIVARLHPERVEADIRLTVAADDARTRLNGSMRLDRADGDLSGEIRFQRLAPKLLVRAVPQLQPLASVRMPVSGFAEFRMSEHGHMTGLHVAFRSRAGRASLEVAFSPEGEATGVAAVLHDVNLAVLGRATPGFAGLAGIDVPANGRLEAALDSEGALRLTQISLSGGTGSIEIPGFLPEAVSIRGLRLQATAAPDLAAGARGEMVLDLGGPTLTLAGAMHQVGDRYNISVNSRLTDMAVSTLYRYWPQGLGAGARSWVTANIVDGTVAEARTAVILDAPVDDLLTLQLVSIAGTLHYDRLGIRFWKPMPLVTEVSGTARFDGQRFDFAVANGRFEGMAIDRGTIAITGLDEGQEAIAIDLALRGPLRNVVEAVNREPLGAIEKLGVPAKALSGETIGRLSFAFPLLQDIDWDQIRFGATAELRNVAMSPTPYGVDLAGADLKLDLDSSGMTVRGHGRLEAVPVTIDWTEAFEDDVELRRRLTLSGRIDDLGKPGLGLPDLPFVRGPAGVGVVLTQPPKGPGELLATFELNDTEIAVSSLGVHKKPGTPGSGGFTIRFADGTKPEVERFNVNAGPLSLFGSAQAHPHLEDGWRVDLETFRNGDSGFGGHIDILPDGTVFADVSGKRFDMSSLIDSAVADTEETPRIPLKLRGRFEDLIWGESGRMSGVDLQAHLEEGTLRGLLLTGTVGASGLFSLRLLPGQEGQVLRIDTDDLGSALRTFGVSERVREGTLVVHATRASPDADFHGDFVASGFTVRQAPLLARVLQVASLTGILDILGRQGIMFENFSGSFGYRDGTLTVPKARGHGSSLGLSINGALDLRRDQLDFAGMVVPAYTLNRVLGQIPLLGTLLTGVEGEGVFAASYRIAGPIETPQVSVNPLSALAPGLLRDLFGLEGRIQTEPPSGPPASNAPDSTAPSETSP